MKSMPTGMFICDSQGIVRFINDAYAAYLQHAPEQIIGRHISNFIPNSRILNVLATGEPVLGESRQLTTSDRPLLLNRIPLKDADGTVLGAMSIVFADSAEQWKQIQSYVDRLDRKVSSYERRMRSAFTPRYSINSILGNSECIRDFKTLLLRYAASGAAVMILGPTGSGKELAANAVHMASAYAEGPFVSINCATIPKDLFESEMLGYAPGAFSGAHKDGKIGCIELANGGTLFLDEIGDIPLYAQVKLLRVLEEKKVWRLGSSKEHSVNFRLITATNRDLKGMMESGAFREDLYYRINHMTLRMPSLAERRDDIPLLVEAQLRQQDMPAITCSPAAMKLLCSYSWPGNVRELRNVVNRAVNICRNDTIEVEDLPAELRDTPRLNLEGGLSSALQASEAAVLCRALEENHWNVAKTARVLGISRASMYEKMRKCHIQRGNR